MIKKALLASTLATGLVLPVEAKAGLILPPKPLLEVSKPSIIKSENIEFSKHLLAMPLTMGMLAPKAASGITFVGRAQTSADGPTTTQTTSLTSLTTGIGGSAEANDLVIAVYAAGSTADINLSITDGTNNYTLIGSELYSNDTYDANLRVAYKFMGSTPDTSVTFGAASSSKVTRQLFVFRGVSQSTPLDVAAVTATGINSYFPDPPAITPVTPGAWIVVIGAGAGASTASFTAPSDLTNFAGRFLSGTGNTSIVSGVGTKTDWVSGSFNPAAWTGTGDSTNNAWVALTLALRPA